ncbi:MAG: lipocalin-like domain-containing protein, partial [Gammaproteobacteria bacterium]
IIVLIIVLVAALIVSESRRPGASGPGRFNGGSSRLSQLLSDDGVTGYAAATEPRTFSFPSDHGPHPKFRNEWWYLTGNLDGQNGERFGFELTIFRFLLTPSVQRKQASRWQSDQVYIGHFAISDVGNEQFHVAQRFSRGGMGLAGARAEPFRVWVEDWSIAAQPGAATTWRVQAADQDMSLDLNLTQLKPPVLNGQNGLSRKAAEPENASYYYSISRLQTEGLLQIGTQRFAVSGFSWLDREWSSSALSADQAGWDWFALQLDDGSELMLYQLRRLDGSRDQFSAGTWISRSGDSNHLDASEFRIEITQFWDSPLGGRYPSAWQVSVPSLDLQLDVQPVMDDQELRTTVLYWEGAVDVSGKRNGKKLAGRGYVELTGYAGVSNQ